MKALIVSDYVFKGDYRGEEVLDLVDTQGPITTVKLQNEKVLISAFYDMKVVCQSSMSNRMLFLP